MHRKRIITITELEFLYIYIFIKINLKMPIGVWSTLPIFLPIYLHGSLQCQARLTYIHSHLLNCMSILTIIFQMQVNLHADLVYLFISITGIVTTPILSLVNKLETPIHTHTPLSLYLSLSLYIYIYVCVCVKTCK